MPKRRNPFLRALDPPAADSAASVERVARGVQVVTQALASIEGLTPSERTQVLATLLVIVPAWARVRELFAGAKPAPAPASPHRQSVQDFLDEPDEPDDDDDESKKDSRKEPRPI